MTVYKQPRGKTYRYDFMFEGTRYQGNTKQITEHDARLVESEKLRALRHEAGGIGQFYPRETPRFQDWAEVYLAHAVKTLTRPDHPQWVIGVLLRYFGARPKDPMKVRPDEPYHDLRLGEPIARPEIVLDFEAWMDRRGIGNGSKNHYRSMLRRMYTLALRPAYRSTTNIARNPFLDIPSDPTFERTVTLEPADAARWMTQASYHVRLAMGLAALAPKLRLRKVLELQWGVHFQPDPRLTKFSAKVAHYIVLPTHKTVTQTRAPQAMPVSAQLLRILKAAHASQPTAAYVVTYHGKPVKSIWYGVKEAAVAAGIPYGRNVTDGATFHTLRHTAATLLSLTEDDPMRVKDAMGHGDLRTTLKYRHLKPRHEKPAIERLSRQLKGVERAVLDGPRTARRSPAVSTGKVQGRPKQNRQKSNKNITLSERPKQAKIAI